MRFFRTRNRRSASRSGTAVAGPRAQSRRSAFAVLTIGVVVGALAILGAGGDAFGQIIPGGAPRSRGVGGIGVDDPLGLLDNSAALGRPQRTPGQFGIGIGLLPVPDFRTQSWETKAGRLEAWWYRLSLSPAADADEVHYVLGVDAISVGFQHRGIVATANEPVITDAFVSYREFGGAVGFDLGSGWHLGVGGGFSMLTVWGSGDGTVSGKKLNLYRTEILPVPRVRAALEWAVAPTLLLAVRAASGPFFSATTNTSGTAFEDLDASAFAGRPPTTFGLAGTLELNAHWHAFFAYDLLLTHPPKFAAERVPATIHQVAVGVEGVFALSGPEAQLAVQLGASLYNVINGVFDSQAPVYEQVLPVISVGLAVYVNGFTLSLSGGLVIEESGIDVPLHRFAMSAGWFF